PPFNQKAWREENELTDDARWSGYDTPPTSNANYGWILNILAKLSTNGVAGFLLANGALSADGTELAIRKKLLENDKVEAILILPRNLFYSTDISVTLWILNNNKKARVVTKNGQEIHYRDREGEVLFMDLRQKGIPFEKKYVELDPDTRDAMTRTYHNWQQESPVETHGRASLQEYHDEPEFCYSATLEEIEQKGWSLVPSKYIEFVNRDEQIDFDTKMRELQTEMRDLLQQEEESKQSLVELFEKLGYEL
ncbi:MAG: N-6 DNA methylase, partial [Bacteroidales bacterium]|nr:N-6 DNA methylase [Bacteroidales bacterium]